MEQETKKKPSKIEAIKEQVIDYTCLLIMGMAILGDCLTGGVVLDKAFEEIENIRHRRRQSVN